MKFSKANIEIIRINTNDIVTVSACQVVGQLVDVCDFD